LPALALLVALLGIFLAYAVYGAKWLSAESIGRAFRPLYTLFSHKYYLDDLYENIIVRKLLLRGLFAGLQKVDTVGVDGAVNGAARSTKFFGRVAGYLQNGQVQVYALAIGIGVIAIILAVLFTR